MTPVSLHYHTLLKMTPNRPDLNHTKAGIIAADKDNKLIHVWELDDEKRD
jgi:hypothetical protein